MTDTIDYSNRKKWKSTEVVSWTFVSGSCFKNSPSVGFLTHFVLHFTCAGFVHVSLNSTSHCDCQFVSDNQRWLYDNITTLRWHNTTNKPLYITPLMVRNESRLPTEDMAKCGKKLIIFHRAIQDCSETCTSYVAIMSWGLLKSSLEHTPLHNLLTTDYFESTQCIFRLLFATLHRAKFPTKGIFITCNHEFTLHEKLPLLSEVSTPYLWHAL